MIVSSASVKAKAAALGFLASGITDPGPMPHAVELEQWLERGYAGTMRYLHRQAERRKDPGKIMPEARSVVVVLDNYYSDEVDASLPRVARYARGRDYHLVLSERLTDLAAYLTEAGATRCRVFADAGPVPERELAQRAGLGWIGKNTMLIRPGAGSFFFIGSIFTDLLLDRDHPFEMDRCGTCTKCLTACPTGAIVAPRVLDATRCISYLTIEYQGTFTEEQPELHGWGFGCDICNDVCPWNARFAETGRESAYPARGPLAEAGPDYFDALTEAEFQEKFSDTPLERPGLAGMRRNWRAALAGGKHPDIPHSPSADGHT
ncbi:MAG: tRNA epoxyqueuosine(34) reductase QueG [Gemmatimonadota bacterium]